jgi:hypothetical protein
MWRLRSQRTRRTRRGVEVERVDPKERGQAQSAKPQAVAGEKVAARKKGGRIKVGQGRAVGGGVARQDLDQRTLAEDGRR